MNVAPSPVALAEVLARGDVWRGDTLASLPAAAIPSGHAELDAELPGGGWPRGNLVELLVDRSGFGEMSLLLPALARLSQAGGWLALVTPPWRPHAPAGEVAEIISPFAKAFLWATVLVTVASGIEYFVGFRKVLEQEDEGEPGS